MKGTKIALIEHFDETLQSEITIEVSIDWSYDSGKWNLNNGDPGYPESFDWDYTVLAYYDLNGKEIEDDNFDGVDADIIDKILAEQIDDIIDINDDPPFYYMPDEYKYKLENRDDDYEH